MFRFRRALAVSTVGLLALGACGDDESSVDTAAPPASVVTGDSVATTDPATAPADTTAPPDESPPAGDVPTRIVSMYPTGTEMLFAIGAGDQVVAVDALSNYPPEAEAKQTALSGYEPNIEAIAAYEPDLVIHEGTADIGPQLEMLGIPQWEGPAAEDFDDIYAQIEQLGALTGHVGEAAALVATMQTDIEAALASVPTTDVPLRYYHELDDTYFSVTSDTFIGHVYSQFGMHNIADTAEGGTEYPQLSAEFIIGQNPDIIFLGDSESGVSAETVAARAGWGDITAVANGAVIPVSADLSSRWGPRIVEFIEIVATALEGVTVPT